MSDKGSQGPPILRNIHKNRLIRHVQIGCGLALLSAVIFKFAVAIPRQNRYAEFYRDYNGEEYIEKMTEAGVLSSIQCEKKEPPPPEDKKKKTDEPPPPPPPDKCLPNPPPKPVPPPGKE